ncbi:MAG: hypothetical protein A2X08_15350 [Bacteroidetes bacterium GWA2_32_17]|nr:MAG: hypothetical protein A2X08_15350 [Bacteroidetes bacterium GWA2_32_17]
MIKKFILKNFKSHKNTQLDFSNLTVFCGINGVGKSSIIQALLLIRESYLKNSKFDYLDLKSNPVNIGTAQDALYQFNTNNIISFEITTNKNKLHYSFEIPKDSDLVKTLIYKSKNVKHISDNNIIANENLFNKNCQYISASRLGPQGAYKKDDVVIDVYNQISVINGQAEYFVHFLEKKRNNEVLKILCNNKVQLNDLFSQTTAWEREISEGINIEIKDIGNLGFELNFDFNTESGKTNKFKSTNVGFGITYTMPILVAILSSKPDSILFIENPESHLHPNGQSKLIELICLAAQAGIQIVLETHSDHIINGILVQCKKFEESQKGLSKENVSIYHIERDEKLHCSVSTKIKIEEGGRVRYTPKGFFDQFTIDRKFLMGF